MSESGPRSQGVFNTLINLMPDSIAGRAALVAGTLTTGMAAHNMLPVSTAHAQELNDSPAAPQVVPAAAEGQAPLDLGDVNACQNIVMGNGLTFSRNFLKKEQFAYKKSRRTVQSELTFTPPSLVEGGVFRTACDAVTRNHVQLRLVTRKASKANSRNSGGTNYRPWGKTYDVSAPEGPSAAQSAGQTSSAAPLKVRKSLLLPRKLSSKDIRSRRYGVRETIITDPNPAIQTPHIDEANPANDVMGPLMRRSISRVVWFNKSQLRALGAKEKTRPNGGGSSLPGYDSKYVQNKIKALHKECHDHNMAVTPGHRGKTTPYGVLKYTEVAQEDGRHGHVSFTKFRHICGAMIIDNYDKVKFIGFQTGQYTSPYTVDNDKSPAQFVVYAD